MTPKNYVRFLVLSFLAITISFAQNIIIAPANNVPSRQQLIDNLSAKDFLAILNYYGCRIWDNDGTCTQCSRGYYFSHKKICCAITANCANFNTTSGKCEKCQTGYQKINQTCEVVHSNNQKSFHKSLGCANWNWEKQICLSCSFRWILALNKTCAPVSDFCKTYSSSGACTSCHNGYSLQSAACISVHYQQSNLLKINCVLWDSQNFICLQCAQGMKLNGQGACVYALQNCQDYNNNGSCSSCIRGYELNNLSCILKPKYKKIIPNLDSQAVCLDGSPAALYFQQGTLKDKFLLYFIGGGHIGRQDINATLEAAYQTSKTALGSAFYWPQDISTLTKGYLADNQVYQGWNKVIFTYCDGALHQGYSKQPVSYKNTTLYFRGSLIVRSHFKWLIDNHNLDKANKIMLTGGSAGAISVFQWSNYLSSLVQNTKSLYFVPDSGIFLNLNVPFINLPLIALTLGNVVTVANIHEKTPLIECNAAYPGEQWRCMLLEYAYPFLTGKYLWINSQYDSYMIQNGLQISCLTQRIKGGKTLNNCSNIQVNAIQQYRNNFIDFMKIHIKNQNNSAWLIGCSNHVYGFYDQFYDSAIETVPQNSSNTVRKVIKDFLMEDKYIWEQDQAWPSNRGCAY